MIKSKSGKSFPSNYYPKWESIYKHAVATRARNAGVRPHDGPVLVMVLAHFELAKSHHRKTKPVPESWNTKKPDIDNIAKMIMDGLQGIAYPDDAKSCCLHCEKVTRAQGESPFVEVWVSPFTHRRQFLDLYTSVFFDGTKGPLQ